MTLFDGQISAPLPGRLHVGNTTLTMARGRYEALLLDRGHSRRRWVQGRIERPSKTAPPPSSGWPVPSGWAKTCLR